MYCMQLDWLSVCRPSTLFVEGIIPRHFILRIRTDMYGYHSSFVIVEWLVTSHDPKHF